MNNRICAFILLIATLLTYFSSSVISQTNDSLKIYDLSLDELMKLQINSATKKAEPITDIPASISIITRQEIQEQGWRTLEEVLTHVPGFYMINDYLWFGTDNYGMRGFFSSGSFNTMTVMVNGVTQKEDWYNSFPLSKINVPVEAIDRIEIIYGPMSVVYGNNAFLGAINIVTHQNQSQDRISVAGGSNGTYKTFARISGKSLNTSFTVNASAYGSDGINRPYSAMTSIIEPAWNLPNNATSKNQLTDHRKYIDLSLTHGNFYFGLMQTHTKRGVIDYYPGYDDGHLAEIQAANFYGGYRKTFQNWMTLNLKTGYYSFRNRLGYKHNSDTTSYGFNDIYSDAADVELNLNGQPIPKMEITFGAYFQTVLRDKLVVDAPNISDDYMNLSAGLARHDKKYTWATYLQASYQLTNRINVLGGLRIEQTPSYTIHYSVRFDPRKNYDYLSRTGEYQSVAPFMIPRLAILYRIDENNRLKLMYGKAIKQPSIGENMDIVRYPDRPQLKPANMETLELNYIGLISDRAIINFSAYRNRVDNLISRTNQLENGEMKLFNTNSGRLKTLGSELTLQLKFNDKLSSTFSLVYQKSENLQKGYEHIDLEYAPPFLSYATLTYRFLKNATWGLSGYYISPMETYWRPDNRDPNNPMDQRDPIQLIADGYRIGNKANENLLLNTNIRFTNLLNKGVYANFYIFNLFDSDMVYPTTRSNDEFEKGTFGYNRYFLLGIGYQF
jgi:outer membrane receptor for ferrienterochelin and colicin